MHIRLRKQPLSAHLPRVHRHRILIAGLFGRKVVAFVDHYRLILAAGDLAAIYGADDVADQAFVETAALGWQCLPVGCELAVAPAVKVPHMHAVAQAFGVHHAGFISRRSPLVMRAVQPPGAGINVAIPSRPCLYQYVCTPYRGAADTGLT